MERRRLGRLGHESSVVIYGGAMLSEVSQEVADSSVQEALDAGVNHFDVAASYGEAELRLGPLVPSMRDRIFLASKTGDRDREAAWASINRSLERLQTDRLDLIQLHAVGDLDELDRVTGPGGSLEAAVRAQEEGLVGAVGITGHEHTAPATHLEALRRHPFATVLTPLNVALWARPEYRADYSALVDEVRRQDVGLMLIKVAARRNWVDVDGPHPQTTWYEPLTAPQRIRAAVSWQLSHTEATGFASPGDVSLLRHVIAAEGDRMPADEAERLLLEDPEYSSPFIATPI